jgi:hypothetical protein
MNPKSHKSIAIAGALLLAAVVFVCFFRISWPESGSHQKIPAMLALELPHDVEEFKAIVHVSGNPVAAAQRADFAFIACYVIFFFTFAIGVADDRTMTSMILATLVTALMDIGENVSILHAIHTPPATTGMLRTILIFGCAKWIGFFAIVLAAAVAMQNPPREDGEEREDETPPRPGFWAGLAALVFRLFALVGIYGAIASFASAAARPLVAISMSGAAMTFTAVLGFYAVGLIWPQVPVPAATSSSTTAS